MLTTPEELEATERKARTVFGRIPDESLVLGPYQAVSYDGRFFILKPEDGYFYLVHPNFRSNSLVASLGWSIIEFPIKKADDAAEAINELNLDIRSWMNGVLSEQIDSHTPIEWVSLAVFNRDCDPSQKRSRSQAFRALTRIVFMVHDGHESGIPLKVCLGDTRKKTDKGGFVSALSRADLIKAFTYLENQQLLVDHVPSFTTRSLEVWCTFLGVPCLIESQEVSP